jgi:peptidoglycan/xylan/chitin deacetylase (PgdA/CDA1 family)
VRRIVLDGAVRPVVSGTTVAQAARLWGLRPRAGDLVDVEGVPLERNLYPGSIRLNGRRADLGRVLSTGDVLEVVDGRDREEGVERQVIPVPSGEIPNPQTHLGTVPGDQIIRTGVRSGKLVSSEFHPTGSGRAPRAVALTFDDGPSRLTLRILQVLRRFEAKATFFMVGYLAERYGRIVRRVVGSGMSVGNHSMNHPRDRPFAHLPPRVIESQIQEAHRTLVALGAAPAAFRPPGGSWSDEVLAVAGEVGERVVLWSVDARDFETRSPAMLARTVVRASHPGSIVLLHDGGGDRRVTVRSLPRIIRGLRAKGLALETL